MLFAEHRFDYHLIKNLNANGSKAVIPRAPFLYGFKTYLYGDVW